MAAQKYVLDKMLRQWKEQIGLLVEFHFIQRQLLEADKEAENQSQLRHFDKLATR